jgi:hypothetical protein
MAPGMPAGVSAVPVIAHRRTRSGPYGRTRISDGQAGRDQQYPERGDVAGIDAVRLSKREQHLALRERFHDHQPDSHGGQHQRQDTAPTAGPHTARHIPDSIAW